MYFIRLLLLKMMISWCTTFLTMVMYQQSTRYFSLTDFTKKCFGEDNISFATVLQNTAYQKARYKPLPQSICHKHPLEQLLHQ